MRRILCPVFKNYGVRVAFGGHDHNYYHTTRDGITYIVTGGGGAPLYPCNKERGVIDGDKYLSCHHFLVCDVNGDSIRIQVIKVDGTELEHFSISAKKR